MSDLRMVGARRRLPALDGLRAVGVLMVMAYHSGYDTPAGLALTGFFVMSGFLITWLLRNEQRATGTISLRRFYVRRVLRIFPAYYACIALSLVTLTLLGRAPTPEVVTSAVAYLMNYYNAFHHHPDVPFSHFWSLAVEEQFYLLWPMFLVVFLGRRRPQTIALALASIIVVVMEWRTFVFVSTYNTAYTYNAFDTRFDSLAVGCLLAICVEGQRFRRIVTAATSSAWYPFIPIALLLASQRGEGTYRYSVGLTFDSLLLGLFIVQVMALHKTRMWRWLQYPTVRYVGLISYPMYLWHLWGIGVGNKATFLPSGGRFVISVLVTVVAGAVSYHVIERPFLRLKKRFDYRWVHPQLAGSRPDEMRHSHRFAFGENWDRFLRVVDVQRIAEAERSLRQMVGHDLRNRRFLDVGSGSGLFSLAARRLGADVRSFDYDSVAVKCTAELKQRFYRDDPHWIVEQGSALDRTYVESLGTYDVVYAWGVLHHTGAMWQALENILRAVAPDGRLFVAISNDQGSWSARWRRVKQFYNSGPLGRTIVRSTFIPAFAVRNLASDLVWRRNPVQRYSQYKRNRGMSVLRDWVGWLGGYPFEVAKPEHVFEFLRDRGFVLQDLKTCGGSMGCNEFIFQRPTVHSGIPALV
jgi:peptidoglycan/LPS O-acetylase OafA/YrhL/2-polyprenyl-3-methyl-5-hydroxy-6-metoxy-1,4-benzoquinol methylase